MSRFSFLFSCHLLAYLREEMYWQSDILSLNTDWKYWNLQFAIRKSVTTKYLKLVLVYLRFQFLNICLEVLWRNSFVYFPNINLYLLWFVFTKSFTRILTFSFYREVFTILSASTAIVIKTSRKTWTIYVRIPLCFSSYS